jgi:hypothetical protein
MDKVELDPYKLYNIQNDHTFYIVECDNDDENTKNDIKYEVIISIRYKNKYTIYHDNINPLYLQNVSDTNYVYNGKYVKCVCIL